MPKRWMGWMVAVMLYAPAAWAGGGGSGGGGTRTVSVPAVAALAVVQLGAAVWLLRRR